MQEALVTVSNLRRKPWGHRSWEGSLVILQPSLLLEEPPGVSWIMWLRGFASQVLKTSGDEVLSSGWVTYPSALALRLKNFFPNLQLEFSLCSLWWRLLSFHWAWWFYHHAVICWLLGSPRSGIGKNGFWSAVTSIVTSCCIFPSGLLSIFSLSHWKWSDLGAWKGHIPFIFLLKPNRLNANVEVCYLLRDGMSLLGPLVIRALIKTMNWEHKWSDRKR